MTDVKEPDEAGRPLPRKRRVDLARRAQIGHEKRARTRRAVMDAAFDLLGREHGLFTRIEEICGAAGVSRGTFYNYFTGMREVFEALSYDLSHDFNMSVTEVIGQLPEAAERVSAAVRFYLQRALGDPQWAWAMVNVSAGGPIFGQDTHAAAFTTAREGMESGEFDLPSAELGRDLQLGTGLAAMIAQLRGPQPPGYAEQVASQVLLAMGVERCRIAEVVARPLPRDL